MKKIILLTLALSFAASFSFAQMPGENYKQITGKVKTLTIGKPSKGIKSQIVVVDDKAGEMKLVVDSEATFWDSQFYAITLDEIKVNDRINIRYNKTDEGVNNAYWFNLLE